jgi:hypothetical protein
LQIEGNGKTVRDIRVANCKGLVEISGFTVRQDPALTSAVVVEDSTNVHISGLHVDSRCCVKIERSIVFLYDSSFLCRSPYPVVVARQEAVISLRRCSFVEAPKCNDGRTTTEEEDLVQDSWCDISEECSLVIGECSVTCRKHRRYGITAHSKSTVEDDNSIPGAIANIRLDEYSTANGHRALATSPMAMACLKILLSEGEGRTLS